MLKTECVRVADGYDDGKGAEQVRKTRKVRSVIGWEERRQEREPGGGSEEDCDCVFMVRRMDRGRRLGGPWVAAELR
jgi:hypothetical protein